jgi:methionine salvage enolase-phosphatase E1
MSIFSNSSHLEWRAGLSDIILKGTHQGTIPARFGLIWFSGFREEDLNAIFYQNMPNLHKWSLDGSLPKMCPVVRPSDQDGCTAELSLT